MLIVGGRTNNIQDKLSLEVYDTETSEWWKCDSRQCFRHAVWFSESFLYIHGGFKEDSPNIPTAQIFRANLTDLFEGNQNLIKSIARHEKTLLELDSKKVAGNNDAGNLMKHMVKAPVKGSAMTEESTKKVVVQEEQKSIDIIINIFIYADSK
jgi:hypothetical protein